MSDEMIQLPIENDAMDEIFQTLSQIGEVVENEQTEKRNSLSAPNVDKRYHNQITPNQRF